MKNLKIHNDKDGNLISIKSIEDCYADRRYLASIIDKLFSLTGGCLYIEVSRPNYDVSLIMEKLKNAFPDNIDLATYVNFLEVSFCYNGNKLSNDMRDILSDIWFSYEHRAFCFFVNSEVEFDLNRKPWYKITSGSDSFIMFKGVEEDVLWIGKSDSLAFELDTL